MNSVPTADSENAATLPQPTREALSAFTHQLNELCSLNHLYRISTQVLLEQHSDLEEPYKDKLLFALNLNTDYLETLEHQLKDQLQHLLQPPT